MKNIGLFLSATLVLVIFNKGIAQKINIAPDLGSTVSLFTKTELGQNAQFGVYAGGRISYKLNKHFSLISGITCNQKKIEYNLSYQQPNKLITDILSLLGDSIIPGGINTNSDISVAGRVNGYFIELPLSVSYNYERLRLNAGAYAGYLLKATTKEVTESRFPLTQTIDIGSLLGGGTQGDLISSYLPKPYDKQTNLSDSKSGLNIFDAGFTIGIGYEYEKFGVNLTYSRGLLDYRNSRGSEEEFTTFRSIRLTTCYWFEIKTKPRSTPTPE